ncbi:hypothetical protein [Streptomyces sp. CBMA123]|uniref:hypothetical protein n=1 Tax=Streptomyces sp. CBMA123 TaxID=1896313 RepID=UPI0016619C4B|nr:hypothetical protein [Streptomyces sp. CBMA123]MBD0694729.1 hypothetical protein [Streptomyces sp. CBMA123]
MPSNDAMTILISLDQDEVALVTVVLLQAVDGCRAVTSPEAAARRGSGVTIGQLAAQWTEIAERELHCSVVNMNGERLFTVPLTPEGWYQVRAALSESAAQLSRPANGGEATVRANRDRARRALLLADRIVEATSE